MKAVTYQGSKDVQVKNVEAPKIEHEQDMIVKITSTAICGSDLHLYQATCLSDRATSLDMNLWALLKRWVQALRI